MIVLGDTSSKIQLIVASAGTIRHTYSYVDLLAGVFSPDGKTNPVVSTATTVDLVPVPAASTKRNVKNITVANTDAAVVNLIVIQQTNGTDINTLWKGTLLPGERVSMDESGNWTYYDASGRVQISPGSGQFIRNTVLTTGTTFTTQQNTNTIKVRMVAGGGAGGGCTSVASAACAAGGGSGGSYLEATLAVTPGTTYTVAIGAGGVGVSGAGGGTGGNSTLVVGSTTLLTNGGNGGGAATATTSLTVASGATGSGLSTGGSLNSNGESGDAGYILIVATPIGASGKGGNSPFGQGGRPVITPNAGQIGTGFGSGGSGGITGASAARAGGNGTPGVIIIDEYT